MESGDAEASNPQKQLADEIMETLNRFTSLASFSGTPEKAPPPVGVNRTGSLPETETPPVVFTMGDGPSGDVSTGSSMVETGHEATAAGSSWRRSPSSSNSYNDEWDWLFGGRDPVDLVSHLADCSLRGNLRSCRFRSICWKVYLGVLSGDRTRWSEETELWRQRYRDLCSRYVVNPRHLTTNDGAGNKNGVVFADGPNHPLSQCQDSSWHRFFLGKSRKDEIMKDVTRTFPDLGFFQTELAQTTMINVLFIYSNVSPLAYRQGMHELLAPIIFVLHSDHLAFQHASEMNDASATIGGCVRHEAKQLLNLDYLEHDAYAIFSQLMKVAGQWYVIDEFSPASTPSQSSITRVPEPFHRPYNLFKRGGAGSASDSVNNCPAIVQLSRIHDEQLKRTDLVLYEHLERLEIVPQFYGIRWLRLLFGREFPLQDLLVVWDAIFATCDKALLERHSTAAFPLVDHLFVVMVVLISDLLCRCDFAQAVMHLMNYPLYCDVHTIVASALHSYRPAQFEKPPDRALCPLMLASSAHGGTRTPSRMSHSSGSGSGATVRRTQSALAPRTSSQLNVINAVGLEGLTARLRTSDMGSKLIRRFGASSSTTASVSRERPKSLMVNSSGATLNGSVNGASKKGTKGVTELQRMTLSAGIESAPVTPVTGGPASGYTINRLPRRKMRSSRSAERGPQRTASMRHTGTGGPSGDFVEILTQEEERRQLEANLRATLQTIDNYRQLTRRCGDLVETGIERLQAVTRRIGTADRKLVVTGGPGSGGGIVTGGAGFSARQIEELTLALADLKKARDYLRGSLTLTSGEPMDDDRSSAGQSSVDEFKANLSLAAEVELRELNG